MAIVRQPMRGLGNAPYAAILNMNRPGNNNSFYVGESWAVTIQGAANAAVWLAQGHSGSSQQVQEGTTDAAGNFTATGYFTNEQLGQWLMNFTVGGVAAPQISVQVSAAPSSTTGNTTGTLTNSVGGMFDTVTEFATQQVMGFPLWQVAAVGYIALKVFGKHRR